MIKITHSFTVDCPIDDVWRFFNDFERLAPCIPTLKTYHFLDADHAEGKVGIQLGAIPVESAVTIQITERRAPCCIKAEGLSFLGATIQDQLKRGAPGSVSRDAVGKMSLHFDLREAEGGKTLILWEAGVEAEGKLRKIYDSIIRLKVPALQAEFQEKISAALDGERERKTEGVASFSSPHAALVGADLRVRPPRSTVGESGSTTPQTGQTREHLPESHDIPVHRVHSFLRVLRNGLMAFFTRIRQIIGR